MGIFLKDLQLKEDNCLLYLSQSESFTLSSIYHILTLAEQNYWSSQNKINHHKHLFQGCPILAIKIFYLLARALHAQTKAKALQLSSYHFFFSK